MSILILTSLTQARNKREEMEDQVAALSLQQTSLQELLATLKDGRGAQKVAEWHAKIDGLRLDELKQRRNNSKLQQQVLFLFYNTWQLEPQFF